MSQILTGFVIHNHLAIRSADTLMPALPRVACPGGLAAPRILYEVNVLVSGGLRGLMR